MENSNSGSMQELRAESIIQLLSGISDKDSLATIAVAFEDIIEEAQCIAHHLSHNPQFEDLDEIETLLIESSVSLDHIAYHITEFKQALAKLIENDQFSDKN